MKIREIFIASVTGSFSQNHQSELDLRKRYGLYHAVIYVKTSLAYFRHLIMQKVDFTRFQKVLSPIASIMNSLSG